VDLSFDLVLGGQHGDRPSNLDPGLSSIFHSSVHMHILQRTALLWRTVLHFNTILREETSQHSFRLTSGGGLRSHCQETGGRK